MDCYNWNEMERHLYGDPDAWTTPDGDEDDDGDDGDDGDEFYEEDSKVATGDEVY
jgi:hypothetical protein